MNLSAAHIKDPKFKKLCQKIISEMKRLSIPGVSVGVWDKGGNSPQGSA